MRDRLARALRMESCCLKSSERDSRASALGHKALLYLKHRAAEGPTELRLRQEDVCDEAAGTQCRGFTRQRETALGRFYI